MMNCHPSHVLVSGVWISAEHFSSLKGSHVLKHWDDINVLSSQFKVFVILVLLTAK